MYSPHAPDGPVKIGYTGRPISHRLAEAQTFARDPLVLLVEVHGTRRDEARLHKLFAPYRIHGEWFRYETEIRDLVAHILDGADLDSWLESRESA